MNELDKAVGQIIERYKSAVLDRDVAAFMRLYDPDVRIFDAWDNWSYEGAAQWQVAVEAWFTPHAAERIEVGFEHVQCAGTLDVCVVSALVTYVGVSAQGDRLRAIQNRISWGLQASGNVLRIVHEHTSVPVGFQDMKAILQHKAGA
jgi:ketosteroid isomerase-like protein